MTPHFVLDVAPRRFDVATTFRKTINTGTFPLLFLFYVVLSQELSHFLKMSAHIECPVCLDHASHNIVTLACNLDTPNVDVCHSFCQQCIVARMELQTCPSCPLCNTKFTKVDLEAIKSYSGRELFIQSTYEHNGQDNSVEEVDELDESTDAEQLQRLRERIAQLEESLVNNRERIANLLQLRDALPDNRVDRRDITQRITTLYVRADNINSRLDRLVSLERATSLNM